MRSSLPLTISLLLPLLVSAGPVLARSEVEAHPGLGSVAARPSPYAGHQHRVTKALSDAETADLFAGRGMGLALSAELNRYPGPLHTLELADALSLSDEQIQTVKRLHAAMTIEAIHAGEAVIAAETSLDRLFAAGNVTPEALASGVVDVASARGQLRRVHLSYHLLTREVLTSAQIDAYVRLRGYAGAGGSHAGHHGP